MCHKILKSLLVLKSLPGCFASKMTISPVESRINMIVYLVSQVTVKRGFLAELVLSPVVKYHKVKQ